MTPVHTPPYTWPLTERTTCALKILHTLAEETKNLGPTLIDQVITDYGRNSYLILIACLLSLRARDTVTGPVTRTLFSRARTPEEMLALSIKELEKILYPLGFYRQKSKTVHAVSRELIKQHQGLVPKAEQELRALPGVGQKTAHLVMSEAFDIPALCVDTHVHRLANSLGLVNTKTPEETEKELTKIYPKTVWQEINRVFVLWGQHVCKPHCKCTWKQPCTPIAHCYASNLT